MLHPVLVTPRLLRDIRALVPSLVDTDAAIVNVGPYDSMLVFVAANVYMLWDKLDDGEGFYALDNPTVMWIVARTRY